MPCRMVIKVGLTGVFVVNYLDYTSIRIDMIETFENNFLLTYELYALPKYYGFLVLLFSDF